MVKQRLRRPAAWLMGAIAFGGSWRPPLQSSPAALGLPRTPPPDQGRSFDAERIAQRLDKVLVDAGFSGAFLAVRDGETVLERGYGHADPERKTPNTEHTLYDVASLSKSFTAISVLLLEHSGKLSTGDRIADYLPGVPADSRDVTILQLLTHTGGVPRIASASGTDRAKAVRDYLSRPPSFPAGTGYEYSNGGYALLAAIVESVSAMSFEEFCRKQIFGPAGMTQSGFCGEAFVGRPVGLGFVSRTNAHRNPTADPYPPLDAFGWEHKGMGGVISSACELKKFVAWIYGGGLPEAVRSKFLTGSQVNPKYACGWEVFEFEDGVLCHGHGGKVAGFQSKLWWFPESKSLIIILANRDDLSWSILPSLKRGLLGPDD